MVLYEGTREFNGAHWEFQGTGMSQELIIVSPNQTTSSGRVPGSPDLPNVKSLLYCGDMSAFTDFATWKATVFNQALWVRIFKWNFEIAGSVSKNSTNALPPQFYVRLFFVKYRQNYGHQANTPSTLPNYFNPGFILQNANDICSGYRRGYTKYLGDQGYTLLADKLFKLNPDWPYFSYKGVFNTYQTNGLVQGSDTSTSNVNTEYNLVWFKHPCSCILLFGFVGPDLSIYPNRRSDWYFNTHYYVKITAKPYIRMVPVGLWSTFGPITQTNPTILPRGFTHKEAPFIEETKEEEEEEPTSEPTSSSSSTTVDNESSAHGSEGGNTSTEL